MPERTTDEDTPEFTPVRPEPSAPSIPLLQRRVLIALSAGQILGGVGMGAATCLW